MHALQYVPGTSEHFFNAVYTLCAVSCIRSHNPMGHVVAGQKALDCLCLFRLIEQNITNWVAHKQEKLIFLEFKKTKWVSSSQMTLSTVSSYGAKGKAAL